MRRPLSETERIHFPSEVVPTSSACAEPTRIFGNGWARFAACATRRLLAE